MGKKKIKPGLIEADGGSLAIIVNYVEEVTEDDGHVTKTQKMKKVRLNQLDADSNLSLIAEKVVEDCKYIPSSRLGKVEEALMALRRRMIKEESEAKQRGGGGGGGGGGGVGGGGGAAFGEVRVSAPKPER